MIMEITTSQIEFLGYKVIRAGTGGEALTIINNYKDRIDLVLTTIKLPDMELDVLCSTIKNARPDLKIMVCGENILPSDLKEIMDFGVQEFIQRPFSLEKLSKQLKTLI